jgi:hypothetical protein
MFHVSCGKLELFERHNIWSQNHSSSDLLCWSWACTTGFHSFPELQAGEISDGQSITKRSNSIKVGREKGHVVYVAESETEMVEWMSALETTVTRLMKIIAGVSDEPPATGNSRTSANNASFLKQMESNMESSVRSSSSNPEGSGYGRAPSGRYLGGQGSSMGHPTAYPGLQAPSIPSPASSYSTYHGGGSGGSGSSGVYQDKFGVSYGTGTGATIAGVLFGV